MQTEKKHLSIRTFLFISLIIFSALDPVLSNNTSLATTSTNGISVSAIGTYDDTEVLYTPGIASDVIELFSGTAIINFTTFTPGLPATEVNFLGIAQNLEVTSDISDFTVLLRITTPGHASPVRIDGNIRSTIFGGAIEGGNVWISSPGGIIIGGSSTIQTGAVLLTTCDIDPTSVSSGAFDVDFQKDPIPFDTSAVIIESGGSINCSQNESYAVCLAPKIEQEGSIYVNGSVVMVAAEVANIRQEGVLLEFSNIVEPREFFSISVDRRSSASVPMIHTGIISGPASAGIFDPQQIILYVPDNNLSFSPPVSPVMRIGGTLGFEGPGCLDDGEVLIVNSFQPIEPNIVPIGTIDLHNELLSGSIELLDPTIASATAVIAGCISGSVNNPDQVPFDQDSGCASDKIEPLTVGLPDTISCVDSLTLDLGLLSDTLCYFIAEDDCIIDTLVSAVPEISRTISLIDTTSSYQVFALQKSDSSIYLDGISTSLQIPHSDKLRPTFQLTLSAWVYSEDLVNLPFQEIYRKEDGNDRHLLSFQESGTILAFGLQTDEHPYQELDAAIDRRDFEGKWVHVAATYDGSFQRLFINGTVIAELALTGTLSPQGSQPAYIGSWQGGSEFFRGRIDDVTLWDRALIQQPLSAAQQNNISENQLTREISDLMSNNPQFTHGMIFYLDMDSLNLDTIYSAYDRPMKAALLSDNMQHGRPDTVLREGAYESVSKLDTVFYSQQAAKIFVDSSATSGLDIGCSWEHAFIHIDSAVTHLSLADTLFIAEGIYPLDQILTISNDLNIQASKPSGGGLSNMSLHPTTILSDAIPALRINAPSSTVVLQSLLLDKSGDGIPELEILKGVVELDEVELKE